MHLPQYCPAASSGCPSSRQQRRRRSAAIAYALLAVIALLLVVLMVPPLKSLAYATSLMLGEPLRWFLLYDRNVELGLKRDGFDVTFSAYPAIQQSARGPTPQDLAVNVSAIANTKFGHLAASSHGLPQYEIPPEAIQHGEDVVPAIIHHIVLGMEAKPSWIKARDTCLAWHPDYDYMFWDDARADELVRMDFPHLYDMWLGYKQPIQRADSLRYMVMYKYGGIFLDMDIECRRSLGPLRRFEFVAPAAAPSGVSNGFFMTKARSEFVGQLVEHLPVMNRNWFFLPYAAVMFSTGCFYMSAIWARYWNVDTMRVLTGPDHLHRLSGRARTPLFLHLGSSSWHSYDVAYLGRLSHWFSDIHMHPFRIGLLLGVLLVTGLVAAVILYMFKLHRKASRRYSEDAYFFRPALPSHVYSVGTEAEEAVSLLTRASTPSSEASSYSYRP